MPGTFRFEGLDIWQRAVETGHRLFAIADQLEEQKLWRFAEQLRGATLSISNNIAEGSGSNHDTEFAHFLNIARRSTFECANMLLVFSKAGYLDRAAIAPLLSELDELSRMLTAFRRTLAAK